MKKIKAKRNRNASVHRPTTTIDTTRKQTLSVQTQHGVDKDELQTVTAFDKAEQFKGLVAENRKLVMEINALTKNVAERFKELAMLTMMLEAASKNEYKKDAQIESLLLKKDEVENLLAREQATTLGISQEFVSLREEIAQERQDFELELAKKDNKLKSAARKIAELSLLRLPVDAKAKKFFLKKKASRGSRSDDARIAKHVKLLRYSGLFDSEWYLQRYPDVRAAKVDPVEHYLRYGADEHRNPGPLFDTAAYAKQNPDVVAENMNCLVHYLYHGREEGRQVHIPVE